MGKIKDELLDILECPVGHAPLVQHEDWLYSTGRGIEPAGLEPSSTAAAGL